MLSERIYSQVLEARFRSITPWWGGGPYGTTRDPSGAAWYPSAETIVGRTKWFARVLAWTCRYSPGSEMDHSRVEGYIRDLFGYGEAPDTSTRPSMFRLSVGDASHGRQHSFADVQNVPRIKLGLLGREFLRDEDMPLDDVSFSASIRVPPKELGGSPEGARRFAAAMILTLAYAGIGRAANRGFGRFYPVELNPGEGMGELRELGDLVRRGDAVGAFDRGLSAIFGPRAAEYGGGGKCRVVDLVECAPAVAASATKALQMIGEAFLSGRYKGEYDVERDDFAVFGLPRKNLDRIHELKVKRAQSSIIASPVAPSEGGSTGVRIALVRLRYGYLSKDSSDKMYGKLQSLLKGECRGRGF